MSNKSVNPTFALAELRSAIDIAVDDAAACGVRHYAIEAALQDAATAVRVKHAATSPL